MTTPRTTGTLRPVFRVLATMLLVGCTVGEVSLDDRPCPCVAGWRCVDEVCIRDSDAAIPQDASTDGSSPRDAAPDMNRADDAAVDMALVDLGPDAATLDLGQDAGPPDLGPPLTGCHAALGRAVVFCEDFEAALTGWTESGNEFGSVARVGVGSAGLGARFTTSTSAGQVGLTHPFPAVGSGTVYVRAYVRVPPASFASPLRERDVSSLGAGGVRTVRVLAGDDGRLVLAVGATRDEALAQPLATGVCVQLEVTLASDAGGSAVLRVDGTEVARVDGVRTSPAGGAFTEVASGLFDFDGPIALEVDELAVDTAPLACP